MNFYSSHVSCVTESPKKGVRQKLDYWVRVRGLGSTKEDWAFPILYPVPSRGNPCQSRVVSLQRLNSTLLSLDKPLTISCRNSLNIMAGIQRRRQKPSKSDFFFGKRGHLMTNGQPQLAHHWLNTSKAGFSQSNTSRGQPCIIWWPLPPNTSLSLSISPVLLYSCHEYNALPSTNRSSRLWNYSFSICICTCI